MIKIMNEVRHKRYFALKHIGKWYRDIRYNGKIASVFKVYLVKQFNCKFA